MEMWSDWIWTSQCDFLSLSCSRIRNTRHF